MTPRTSARRAVGWGVILLVGCVSGARGPAVPSRADIPVLEAAFGAAPNDADGRLRLALAYRAAGRPTDAVRLLEPGAATASDGPLVALAMAYEDLGQFGDARALFERLASGSSNVRLRREAARRLLAIERVELRAAVSDALTREAQLRATPPAPEVVGVFPFLFGSTNPDLSPLSRALAELLTVDLSQTDRLRVVERAQVQYLLDELALAESGRIDPATAARSGRLLGAGRIVQGRIDGGTQTLRLQVLPVSVGVEPVQEPGAPLLQEGPSSRLFEMQKALALELYVAFGIQLTPAERERVTRRHTQNIQALLAFGFGLEAADAGRLDEALTWFEGARSLDPGFDLADEWVEQTESELDLGQFGPNRIYRIAVGIESTDWADLQERHAPTELLIPSPGGRDAVPEALGVEGLNRRGLLEIIIRGPGGQK